MKRTELFTLLLLQILCFLCGKVPLPAQSSLASTLIKNTRLVPPQPPSSPPLAPPVSWIDSPSPILQSHADQSLRPFYHGVASGDPLSDKVIIWTRVTPETHSRIHVQWQVAVDTGMQQVVAQGTVLTGPTRDYTVKVDVAGLSPGTTYYYMFTAFGRHSLIGRTKTAPVGATTSLRFAVASCANYQHGYFNAYNRIAERNDLDAVLFLGDYLYEDGPDDDDYGPLPGRVHEPRTVLTQFSQYRKRHSFYKLDPALRALHQQHPFIAIWDDHEIADDCFTDGGKEHVDERDGEWEWRRSGALRAYFEWMPVRERKDGQPYRIFRTFQYGNLAEIIMLDTRQEGRAEQLPNISDPALYDPTRSMLGDTQLHWFLQRLAESEAHWKVVGNQVVMAQVSGVKNMDAWDGYPLERNCILNWIKQKRIGNVVFVTGDVHISMAANIPLNPFQPSEYDPRTGDGSLAVELITPSIASANMDELYHLSPRSARTVLTETGAQIINRHVKMIELDSHGYFILDLNAKRARADWYFVETMQRPSEKERWSYAWLTRSGTNRLEEAQEQPVDHTKEAPILAPHFPPETLLPVGVKAVAKDSIALQTSHTTSR